MKSGDSGVDANKGTPISYSSKPQSVDFSLFNYNNFELMINGDMFVTGVKVADNGWHHICVTWDMRGGKTFSFLCSR